jgi:hypothetical protein
MEDGRWKIEDGGSILNSSILHFNFFNPICSDPRLVLPRNTETHK